MLCRKHSNQAEFVGDALLAVEGLVLAVCDEVSEFNRPSISVDAWTSTKSKSDLRLNEYNSYMAQEMASERAIVWILVLWGIFRLRVKLHERIDQMPFREVSELLIGNSREASVNLPTGRLGWIDVEMVTDSPWREIAIVPPGRYICRLAGRENGDHWNLASPADYPPNDEDWILHMALLSPDAPGPNRSLDDCRGR